MNHPYNSFCGCNECEIEGHARDNIADSEAGDGWDSVCAERELAEAQRIEAEEDERVAREDSYNIRF